MQHTSIRKPLSVLLSILMVLSVFGGMAFSAGAESKTIAEGVIYKLGDTIVLPGNGIYYVKENKYGSPLNVSGNGTVTRFEGDEHSYMVMIDEWHIYAHLVTFDYEEELSQGLSVLGITFTGSGTESDPYMPKLAFGEVESTWAGDGEGTEDAPWLINNVDDLLTLSANVKSGMTYSGKFLKVTDNIDCGSDSWEPIGDGKPFRGTFDGDSHTITYIVNITGDEGDKGLFYQVGVGGTIKNLKTAGSITSTSLYADCLGGIAAKNSGTIQNCHSAVDITGYGSHNVGIAMNWGDTATYDHCVSSGTLSWPQTGDFYSSTAGIASDDYGATITNCVSLSDIYAPVSDEYSRVGRLIGDSFNSGTLSDNYYLSSAQTTGTVNTYGGTAKTAEELAEIGQAAYDAGYTVYGLALGAVASNPDQEAADAVIALIDAIGTVALTDECKAKIDAAREAYDALTDAQKALVSNYETLQLAEGQYAALQLAADMTAFEAYKTAKKSAMDALLQEGDSEAVQSIVGLAKTQIEGFAYDESKTLDENKAALDTLVANVPNAVAEQRAAEQTAADTQISLRSADLSLSGGSITGVPEGISVTGLSFQSDFGEFVINGGSFTTTLGNFSSIEISGGYYETSSAEGWSGRTWIGTSSNVPFNGILATEGGTNPFTITFTIKPAEPEIDTAVAEVIALIDAIGTVEYTDECKAKIDAARAAYDALTDAQKAIVTNYETLMAAETDYAALQLLADKAEFDDFKNTMLRNLQDLEDAEDSAETAAIIVNAISDVNDIGYDESKTLAENKAAIIAVYTTAAANVDAQRAADKLAADKAAFEAYKAEQKASVEAMAEEGDSEAAQQIIADAAAAIDALTYDEAKTLDENKAAVDALEDIADALAAQRAADKAAAETPDTPATPADEDDRVCPFCGERHNSKTFMGWIIEYFHDIVFVLQKLFFLR